MSGTLQITDQTAIDLKGYSGINSIAVSGSGGKYALSFDKGVTWRSNLGSQVLDFRNGTVVGDTYVTPNGTVSALNNRSGVVTSGPYIGSLANAFDNDKTTHFDMQDYAKTDVDVVFPVPTSIEKIMFNIATVNLPLDITVQNSDDTWSTLIGTFIVDGDGYTTAPVNKTIKAIKFVTTYSGALWTGCPTFYSIDIYKTNIGWQTIQESEIPTKGMSPEILNALTSIDYASVFQRTQLDMYAYLDSADSLSGLVVNLPPNSAPVINNTKATPDTMHRESVTVSCDIIDLEGEATTYRVLFNGVEYTPTTPTPADGKLNIVFPDTLFPVGLTSIKIEATDERNVKSDKEIFITRVDTKPKLTVVLVDNHYYGSLGDEENDKVQYRILLNGEEQIPWTEFAPSPLSIDYKIDRTKIKFGVSNKLRIEYKDDLGLDGFAEEDFIGSYYGLLFIDPMGDFYSNDLGEVIKKLDIGTIIANQTSEVKEVQIFNKCGCDLGNTVVSVPTEINTKVYIELSEVMEPFQPVKNIQFNMIENGIKKSFFIRATSVKTSVGGGDFKITVNSTQI